MPACAVSLLHRGSLIVPPCLLIGGSELSLMSAALRPGRQLSRPAQAGVAAVMALSSRQGVCLQDVFRQHQRSLMRRVAYCRATAAVGEVSMQRDHWDCSAMHCLVVVDPRLIYALYLLLQKLVPVSVAVQKQVRCR